MSATPTSAPASIPTGWRSSQTASTWRVLARGRGMALDAPGVRLLFVGGLIDRKGPDLLMAAFLDAFAGRDDVTLVVKDFGADGIYPKSDRSRLREYAESGQSPRIVYLHRDMHVRGARVALPRLRRARPPVPGRGLRDAGARGDGVRAARDRHRRRPHRRVLPRRRLLAHPPGRGRV